MKRGDEHVRRRVRNREGIHRAAPLPSSFFGTSFVSRGSGRYLVVASRRVAVDVGRSELHNRRNFFRGARSF